MIGPKTSTANRPHRMFFQNPGPAVPDGHGGSTQTWFDLVPPALFVEIKPATAAELERVAAGTVISTQMSIVKGPFHPQVTTQSRGLFNGRIFNVKGDQNIEERNGEMVLVCVEIVP
jgi:head-tail adaptor